MGLVNNFPKVKKVCTIGLYTVPIPKTIKLGGLDMEQVAIYAYKNVLTTGFEVQTQIDECTRYAKQKGLEIVGVYADIGTRQQRTKLLRASRQGKFSCVLTKSPDRLGRCDCIRILEKLHRNGIAVYCTDGTDTKDVGRLLDLFNVGEFSKKEK